MSDCRTCRETMMAAAGAPGTPTPAVKEHLAMCDECRHEFDEVQKILAGAEAVREERDKAMAAIDWDSLSERITETVWKHAESNPDRPRARERKPFWAALLQPRLRPVLAGIMSGLLIGSLATYVLLKRGPAPRPAAHAYTASGEFIDRVEYEMAKRETIDYLEKSEYVLLDLVQSPLERSAAEGPSAYSDRISALLSKKRYFNPRLDDVRMAKARDICDQIEMLFLDLSQISDTLTPEETARMRKYVEDKRLLLKIRLLKKELKENGV
jgi:hypothetical protein